MAIETTPAAPKHDAVATGDTASTVRSSTVTAGQGKRYGLVRNLAEFLTLVVLAIVALEVIFRLCGIGQQEFLEPDPRLGCRHIANQPVVWRLEGYSSDRFSSQGLRDVEHSVVKPVGVTRIALLGDSSTEGMQVPLQLTYAKVLEKELNKQRGGFEVINFACSSYSTGQEYVQLKEQVEKYKPDITVLLYNCGDSLDNVRDPKKVGVEPRPYFYLDSQGHLQEDDLLLRSMSTQSKCKEWLTWLQRNSRIYGVLKQADLMLSIQEKLYRKIRSSLLNMYAATAGAISGTQQYPQQYQGKYAKPDGLKVTEELLRSLSVACRKADSKFILIFFPNINRNPDYAREQAELNAFSKQAGIQGLDLTAPFLATANPQELFLQYHFSSRGHKLVANQLAALIEQDLRDLHQASR